MPNWVRNIVKVSEKTMIEIKNKYFENNIFKFNKVIPMPKELMITSGSVTRESILYALALKKPDDMVKTIKNVVNKGYQIAASDIAMLFDDNELKKLKIEARNYIPNRMERELGLDTLEKFGNQCLNNIDKYGVTDWYKWAYENWGTKWDIEDSFSCNGNIMIFDTAWATPIPVFEVLSKEFPEELIEVEYADEDIYGGNVGILHFLNGELVNDFEKDGDFARKVWEYELEENETEEFETEY